MPYGLEMGSEFSSPRLRVIVSITLTILACTALIVLLRVPGLIISFLLVAAAWLMSTARPEATEEQALRTSISLSAEDLRDVMDQFEKFETSNDPDSLADRSLYRPALLDLDVTDTDIEAFHYQYASAARYLKRLPSRMADPNLTTGQLEKLLLVTDQRAAELKESWILARRAAKRLGPNY